MSRLLTSEANQVVCVLRSMGFHQWPPDLAKLPPEAFADLPGRGHPTGFEGLPGDALAAALEEKIGAAQRPDGSPVPG